MQHLAPARTVDSMTTQQTAPRFIALAPNSDFDPPFIVNVAYIVTIATSPDRETISVSLQDRDPLRVPNHRDNRNALRSATGCDLDPADN